MGEQKLIKYGILILFIILTLYQNSHFGDFCEGMSEGILYMLLVLFSFLTFLFIVLRELYKRIIKKKSFDFIPLTLFIVFILSNWFLYWANENRFWKEVNYEGRIDNDDAGAWIVLYQNNTYEVTKSYIEQRCTYGGNYHFENNILVLEDENIENKTDNYFTSKYKLIGMNILQPIDNKHIRIKLKTVKKTR